ncbi:MAG: transposase [Flavobacteriaceae bacterium]|nr:transposase [Flavobacteriaceae bacterium]
MNFIPFEIGNYYHIYNRGNNKDLIFIEEGNYYYFLQLMKKYLIPIADIYSYCLIPNHFHLILKIKDKNELPDAFISLKTKLHQPFSNMFNTYTKAINKRHNRRGSLFQEHLKRKPIKNEGYLRNLIIYVNTNPTKHGIGDFSTYEFNSYKALISKKHTLLKRDETIELFDDVKNFKYVCSQNKINLELIKELIIE